MARIYGQKHFELKSEINVIPLLDVMLVLLLVFMVTIPVSQNIKVDLPNATESKDVNIGNVFPVIIEISGVDQYSMVVDKNRIDQLLPDQIINEVKRYMQSNSKTIFLIGGKRDIPYNEIIKALNLLYSAGVKSVGLMTKPI